MIKDEQPLTPEMMEALERGERPSFPDGSPLPKRIAYSPLTGTWVDATPSFRERVASSFRRLRGSEHTIRMAPDYGAEVPLWAQADATDDLVPEDLLRRLKDWQSFWESHHNWERGWDSEESRTRWQTEGAELASEVTAALPPPWKLKADF